MAHGFRRLNIPRQKISYLPYGASGVILNDVRPKSVVRKELGLENKFFLIYTCNHESLRISLR
jgi:hypothetical protein